LFYIVKYSELPAKGKTTIMTICNAVSYNILLPAVHEYKVTRACMEGNNQTQKYIALEYTFRCLSQCP